MGTVTDLTGLQELAAKIDLQGTRRAAAEQFEISESYLSQILSGERPFTKLPVATAIKISQTYGIPIERLAGGSSGLGRASVLKKRVVGR